MAADEELELRALLAEWDPIGVYDVEPKAPPGEYDCLHPALLAKFELEAHVPVKSRA
jgi:hypothetical protein